MRCPTLRQLLVSFDQNISAISMSKDLFADLLSQSSSTSRTKNDSKLSLNQKQALSNNSNSSTNASTFDLDFLDTYVNKSISSKPVQKSVSANNNTNGNLLDFDFLNTTAMKTATTASYSASNGTSNAYSTPSPTTFHSANNEKETQKQSDLLEDFFGSPVPVKSVQNPPSVQTTPANPTKPQTPKPSVPVNTRPSRQQMRDKSLAELIDMGFSVSQANQALDSTINGYDINESISYLMNNAPKTASRAKPHENDDFGKIVNDLSNDLYSTASFLFNSGKKKIQKGVDMYRQQKLDNNNGEPLWMKNQHKYKSGSIRFEDDDDDMDPETMRELVRNQRLREKNTKNQQRLNADLTSNNTGPQNENLDTGTNASTRLSRSTGLSFEQKYQLPPVSKASSLSSPEDSASNPTLTSVKPTRVSPQSLVQEGSLLDFASAPTSQTPQTLIPALNRLQLEAFQAIRKQAESDFKNGNYTESLEKYLTASNEIPNDHPYQIIINSNLAIVYSKLGNPKKQLSVCEDGLTMVEKMVKFKSVNELSNVCLDANKTLKSFYIKLLIKKAEGLEFIERWSESKLCYEQLMNYGENSKLVIDGKNRCNKALKPTAAKPTPKPRPNAAVSRASTITKENNETLKKVHESNESKKREEQEKFQLHDQIEAKLDQWRSGNKENIRALICRLDMVLWPELNWKPVTLTDLVLNKKVKINYMKAVSKIHPDKIASSESTDKKMIANGVFITLNEAWEKFKVDNNL